MSDDTLRITLDASPERAEALVRSALAEQGFGILSEIDVQSALKEKLDHDIPAYRILGACNPPLAARAIGADPDIGTLLPCNVLLRAATDGGTEVVAADPIAMLSLGADGLTAIATEARERLQRAFQALGSPQS